MSIYASTLGFDGEEHVHPDCAAYFEESPGCWDYTGEPCDCPARFDKPIAYRGSHVYPDAVSAEARGGYFDLGVIPGHIAEGGGYDERHEHWDTACHRPFLRVSFSDPFGNRYPDDPQASPTSGTVVLDERQVRELAGYLHDFLSGITGVRCGVPA